MNEAETRAELIDPKPGKCIGDLKEPESNSISGAGVKEIQIHNCCEEKFYLIRPNFP